MTITQLDITNFGCFKNFIWKNSIKSENGQVLQFKRINIIYGRNYSGKTTLSRIFRSLQTGGISSNIENPAFKIIGDLGEVNESSLTSHGYDIRVYNRDFVSEHLSFLVNQEAGEIKTFAVVGEQNNQVEEQIAQIEAKLGDAERKTGLRYEAQLLNEDALAKQKSYDQADQALTKKLRDHAKVIKNNRDYGESVYDIDSIKKDIKITKENGLVSLTEEDKQNNAALIKQVMLPKIDNKIEITLKYPNLSLSAQELLQRTIRPTVAIQELLNNSLLQLWVKEGISHHRDKRETCAFCRQQLPTDIWAILDGHFSLESIQLETEIDTLIGLVKEEISTIPELFKLTAESFYPGVKAKFNQASQVLEEEFDKYQASLNHLLNALNSRKSSLFAPVQFPIPSYSQLKVDKQIAAINDLIELNNNLSFDLAKDQEKARYELRLDDISTFATTIDYEGELRRVGELSDEASTAKKSYLRLLGEISELNTQIRALRSTQSDQRKAAESVNRLLNHFFGHDGISLKADTDAGNIVVKFQIMRDGQSAYNLSEGECSLIAFCYFIAKLEEPETKDKNLIIYIDDPISSLDGNHIFFLFSLIESLIAKPINEQSTEKNYKQLFVSTHNLDFLKYLKRLSGRGRQDKYTEQFFVSRGKDASVLQLMPEYLRKYITEFNYLFHQIYICSNEDNSKLYHESFYSFGNNLRKFLEAYLFYKYPSHRAGDRLSKFLGSDDIAHAIINRFDNELSHLEESFDRGVRPIDYAEIAKMAEFLLNKLFETDKDQFNSLLESIGEPEWP